MKKVFVIFAVASLCFFACKKTENAASDAPKTTAPAEDRSGPEFTSAYICPMHCKGSGSAQEGKCPACGMDYVKNEEAKPAEQ